MTNERWLFREGGLTTNDGAAPILLIGDDGEASDRVALVDMVTKAKRGEGWKTPCPTRDQRARLIAAAPDLLEALRWALAELRGQTRYDEDVADEQCDNCYKLADAAIAKATKEPHHDQG